jgi:uncharacterized protein YegP (UPF0339 family)
MGERALKIKTYSDKSGRTRWRFIAGNGEQLARSARGYFDSDKLVEDLAHIVDERHDAELYKDKRGEWRWRFRRDGQGKIIAVASEGYKNRKDCKHASDLLLDSKLGK